jgi:peroxiredoxin
VSPVLHTPRRLGACGLAAVLAISLGAPAVSRAQDVEQKNPPPTKGNPSTGEAEAMNERQRIRGSVYTGEPAPDFELPASSGHPVHLSDFNGSWILLIFTERKEGLATYTRIASGMDSIGVKLVGVCDEKAYHLVAFAKDGGPHFPMLADVTGEISALYGLYDSMRATTEPGFFVIDPEGIVRMGLTGKQVPAADIASLVRFAVTGM